MKTKLLILCIAVGLLPDIALCQSTFVLRNKYGGVNAPVFDAGGVPLAGTNYCAELYGGATSVSLTPATTVNSLAMRVIVPFLTGTNAGYFRDGEVAVAWDAYPIGYAWLQLKAWDARLGSTYETVSALGIGGYGESSVFYALGGNPTLVPPGTPEPLIGLQSFNLLPVVPEPSAAALLTLGIASFWCFARRRG